VQSILLVLASINRLTDLTAGYAAPNQFLPWRAVIDMLVLPLASVIAIDLLRRTIRTDSLARGERADTMLGLTFTVGVYLLAAGYGNHEVTNYLRLRYCPEPTDQLCTIIIYNDNHFSHMVFFTGFVLVATSVMLLPVLFPLPPVTGWQVVPLGINAAVIGAAMFANLAFEEVGIDLAVVAVLALIAAALWWRHPREPLFVYYALAWWSGLLATGIFKLTDPAA
jgi:hypothetical protein